MNNTERREQLDRARTQALKWAEQAEVAYQQNASYIEQVMPMAVMWANVAEALKKESGEHDTYVNA